MYLKLIEKKIEQGSYSSVKQLNEDVELMFMNCYTYNGNDGEIGLVSYSIVFVRWEYIIKYNFNFYHSTLKRWNDRGRKSTN